MEWSKLRRSLSHYTDVLKCHYKMQLKQHPQVLKLCTDVLLLSGTIAKLSSISVQINKPCSEKSQCGVTSAKAGFSFTCFCNPDDIEFQDYLSNIFISHDIKKPVGKIRYTFSHQNVLKYMTQFSSVWTHIYLPCLISTWLFNQIRIKLSAVLNSRRINEVFVSLHL